MKIKFTSGRRITLTVNEGQELDLPDNIAKQLIGQGLATVVRVPEPVKAMVSANEVEVKPIEVKPKSNKKA